MSERSTRLLLMLSVGTLLFYVAEDHRRGGGAQRTVTTHTSGSRVGALPGARPSTVIHPAEPDLPTLDEAGPYWSHQKMVVVRDGVEADQLAAELGIRRIASTATGGLHLFEGEPTQLAGLSGHAGVESTVGVGRMRGAGRKSKTRTSTLETSTAPIETSTASGDEADAPSDGGDTFTTPAPSELQWHLAGANIGTPPAGLDGVVVAVVDSGVAYRDWCSNRPCSDGDKRTHKRADSLAGTRIVAPADFVDGDLAPLDEHQHGTHIATTILGHGAIEGVAPGATLMPIRVLDAHNTGSEFALIRGIRHAVANGADIINLSLSFQPGFVPSSHLLEAIREAHDEGVLMLGAAGNQGTTVATWPALSPLVVSVGASAPESDFDNLTDPWAFSGIAQLAPYSNSSATVDIVAPGGDLSADKTGDGFPDGVLAETIVQGDPSATAHYFFEGTSQATAIASGAAARAMALGATADEAAFALQLPARILRGETSADGVGRGYLDVSRSERAVADGYAALQLNRDVRAAVAPYLERGDDGRVRPAARLTAVGASNDLGETTWLQAEISTRGSATPVGCWTDWETGQCTVHGSWVTLGNPTGEAWTVALAGLHYPQGVIGRPTGVIFATDGLDAMLSAGARAGVLPEVFGLGIFWEEGLDDELGDLAASFVMLGGGSGLATAPLAVIATPAAVLPGILSDDPVGNTGTGLSSSPLGVHTADGDRSELSEDSDWTTSPLGPVKVSLTDSLGLDGTGLSSSPLGFTTVTFTPTDLALDASSIAGTGLGWVPIGTFQFDGVADGSPTTIVTVDGTGLSSSPLGLHGADLLQPGGGGTDLTDIAFEDGVMISDLEGSSTELTGTAIGTVVDSGGFVSQSGQDVGSLLGASTLTAPFTGDLASPPVRLGPSQ